MKGCSGNEASSSQVTTGFGDTIPFGKATEKGTPIKENLQIGDSHSMMQYAKEVKQALKYLADAYKEENSSSSSSSSS